jgi:hypothetical protein
MSPALKLAARTIGVSLLWTISSASVLNSQGLPASIGAIASKPNATVKADVLVVYSDMRTSSARASSLKKGDPVIVEFEFKTSSEAWCSVKLASRKTRLGYVQCAGLDRKEELVHARDSGTAAGSTARMASAVALAAPTGPAARGYAEIADLVVRDEAVDVTKLAELDAAARTGSLYAVRRDLLSN